LVIRASSDFSVVHQEEEGKFVVHEPGQSARYHLGYQRYICIQSRAIVFGSTKVPQYQIPQKAKHARSELLFLVQAPTLTGRSF
jgi:hypothetical protein